jgi:hypothetical protein
MMLVQDVGEDAYLALRFVIIQITSVSRGLQGNSN